MATDNRSASGASTVTRPHVAVANKLETVSEDAFAYVLLVPTFLLITVVAIYPLLETFRLSLYTDQLGSVGVGDFVGHANYVDVLAGARDVVLLSGFWYGVAITLGFALVSVFFETLLGLGMALVLDKEFRGRAFVRMAILIPWAVPVVIQGMIFYLLFEPSIGFAVRPLQELGVMSSTPLTTTRDAFVLLITADVWKTTAFMALIILAGLQSIDRSLYEVGRVAGATRWQRFVMITFPLVLPAVLVAMLFRTLQAMQVYGIVVTMSGCSTVPSLTCMVVESFRANRFATSATIAFLTAGIISIIIGVYLVKFVDSLREIGGDV
ncbi:carbohydrate ABC transporter permease [Natronococcus wangiae]|uniref:carbohydrate ABC transporter permease n=1 Tax=Natronococcus wangiae TaxID=3068275 RepID=UPI00273FB581|nr:sugar ABC transporter permease [Natronococcus sp. AD5]